MRGVGEIVYGMELILFTDTELSSQVQTEH